MDHIKQHVASDKSDDKKEQCRYCLKTFENTAELNDHLSIIHPAQTKDGRGSLKCVICRVSKTTNMNQTLCLEILEFLELDNWKTVKMILIVNYLLNI